MEKEFVPYEQALALKELGFDEPCLAQYKKYDVGEATLDIGFSKNEIISKFENLILFCSSPLYQQAFRWFRDKYDLRIWIESSSPIKFDYTIATSNTSFSNMSFEDDIFYDSYEEAELECLKKLIEIVKESLTKI